MSCCAPAIDAPPSTHPTPLDQVEGDAMAAARPLGDGIYRLEYVVPSLHCANCIQSIEQGLSRLPQVADVRVNLTKQRVRLDWRPDLGSIADVSARLDQLGYPHLLEPETGADAGPVDPAGRRLLLALAVAGFAAANIMLLSVAVWSGADQTTSLILNAIAGLIAIPAVAYAGQPFFGPALTGLKSGRMTMDLPVSLAVILALLYGVYQTLSGDTDVYFDAAVTLLFFLLIGRYLDHQMRRRARLAASNLAQLTPRGALELGDDGEPRYIPVAEIDPGKRLLIRTGDRVPVDGTLNSGSAILDRSLVTGEAVAQEIAAGSALEAGAVNAGPAFEMTATAAVDGSFLAEIQELMSAAENARHRYAALADRVSAAYAPTVHILALVTAVGWFLISNYNVDAAINSAVALLIITCPCALGLAAPVVQVLAAGNLFRQGIYVKDGSALERLAAVDTVALDKTGTLTEGKPVVSQAPDLSDHETQLLRSLCRLTTHPNAEALLQHIGTSGPSLPLQDVSEQPGEGISARWKDIPVRLGRPAQSDNRTMADADIEFKVGDQPAMGFQLTDLPRPDAPQTIAALRSQKRNIMMLTGDHAQNADRVAAQVGIDDVAAGLRPQEKLAIITRLHDEGHRVLMVGDGLNDAPALAAGHASMAPGSAADIGRQAADFVFVGNRLGSVLTALDVAGRADRLIRQNFALAIAYNVIAVPAAMFGLVNPLIAALAMSASSIVVVANSCRLGAPISAAGSKQTAPHHPRLGAVQESLS